MVMAIIKRLLFGLGLALLLTGCGGSAESALKEAVEGRWQAMIQGDFQRVYAYYTDAFQETTPWENFKSKKRGSGLWKSAKVSQVNCDESGKLCEVRVKVTVATRLRGLDRPMESSTFLRESWVRSNTWLSDWRYVEG